MKGIDVDRALRTKVKRLGFVDLLLYYAPVLFFYGMLVIDIYEFIKAQITGSEVNYSILNNEFNVLHAFLIVGALVFITKSISLRYKVIDTKITNDRFGDIVNGLVKKLNWKTIEIGENYIVAESEDNFYSHNERVTIVYNENYIMVNSICNPDNSIQMFSYGKNGSNFNSVSEAVNVIEHK